MICPSAFSRRLLVSVVGLTPQVVTETLWALAVRTEPAFVPNELHIVTTLEGRERIELMLLEGKRMLDTLARDWPGRGLEGLAGRTRVHVARDPAGTPLADIASVEANTALADLLVEVVRDLTADPGAAVHLSIAGGRKTMGFLAGYALSLFGRPQDRLSHVLVDPAFEQHPQFFYPPPEPTVLIGQGRDQKPIRTDRCGLVLADIPFVRLRQGLPVELLDGRAGFAATVGRLQERFRPPELVIDLEAGRAVAHGQVLLTSPIELAFLAWLARLRRERGEGAAVNWMDGWFEEFLAVYRRLAPASKLERTRRALHSDPEGAWLSERVARHNKLVEGALGPAAGHYRIEAVGRRPRTRWRLATPPEAIRFAPMAPNEGTA